jgi:hypothetical protein
LANNGSGSWAVIGVGGGIQSSLALDSFGRPHIVFNSETNGEIVYARNDGSGWSSQSVTSSLGEAGIGEYPALALDSHDLPHLSFGFYASDIGIEVMFYTRLAGADWEYVPVDAKNAGFQTSLALDQWDLPHVSYRKALRNSSQLRYADSGIKPPEIVMRPLKTGRVGKKYLFKLRAKLGEKPYVWQVTKGALPAGLTLNSSNGTISGVPTVAGAFEFDVQVTDSLGLSREATFNLTIKSP